MIKIKKCINSTFWNIISICKYRKFKGDIRKIYTNETREYLDVNEKDVSSFLQSYHEQKETQSIVPLIYQPGSAWNRDIIERRAEWIKALNENNITELSRLLSNFMRNSGAYGIQSHYYFKQIVRGSLFTKVKYISEILTFYDIWQNITGGTIKDLELASVGNTWGYWLNNILVNVDSFAHHYFSFRIKNILKNTQHPVVCEIGRGYGGVAYYLMKNDANFCYVNFDLPEVLLISSYFLSLSFPKKKMLLFEKNMYGKQINNLEKYDIILMPNYMLPFLPEASVDVVINTRSLSEMEYDKVKEYIDQVTRISKRYFYHCNSDIPSPTYDGKLEIKASDYPIDNNKWNEIYRCFFPFFMYGRYDNYKEFLYERIK